MATPLRFGPPSLDNQFALSKITSVPALLGGATWAYVEVEVLLVYSPAEEKASCRYSDLSA